MIQVACSPASCPARSECRYPPRREPNRYAYPRRRAQVDILMVFGKQVQARHQPVHHQHLRRGNHNHRARAASAQLLQPLSSLSKPVGDLFQRVLRLGHHHQTLFAGTGAGQQRMPYPLLERTHQLPHRRGVTPSSSAAPVKLPCRAAASKACSHLSLFKERIAKSPAGLSCLHPSSENGLRHRFSLS
ncbi:Uncharacterised protein [Ewingella americana]|uniref:Uncharacterized protein n=1 Tax=Ewingella americana TaxID=41202 RepID=A0A377N958_9GAMM|nr:Uncharacterised protein [Ewingella americana]